MLRVLQACTKMKNTLFFDTPKSIVAVLDHYYYSVAPTIAFSNRLRFLQTGISVKKTSNLKMLVLDTAGPIVDRYSLAPVIAFQLAGKQLGLGLTEEDMIPYLGKSKRLHIDEMMKQPHLLQQFKFKNKRDFDSSDANYFYHLYLREQLEILQRIPLFSEILPEFQIMQKTLQIFHPDLLYAQTSGYPLEVMKFLGHRLKTQGFIPNVMRCSGHTTYRKDMIQQCLDQFSIRVENVAFVSDQQSDLDAANELKVFSIGVTHSVPSFRNANAVCANMKEVAHVLCQF